MKKWEIKLDNLEIKILRTVKGYPIASERDITIHFWKQALPAIKRFIEENFRPKK